MIHFREPKRECAIAPPCERSCALVAPHSLMRSPFAFVHAVQANLQSNTFVVTGNAEIKPAAAEMSLEEQLKANPALLQQLLAQQMAGRGMAGMPGMGGAPAGGDDDDMPELEEDFEKSA